MAEKLISLQAWTRHALASPRISLAKPPLSREGITHLGDERVHCIRVACIYLVARCELGSDLSRHHRAIGAVQHVKDTATASFLIGLVFVALGLGFGDSGYALLKTIPDAVLGGLLLFSGIELALSFKPRIS